VLNAQGTAIGIVGLVLGVPLGVALGRIGWRLVSDQVPLANVPPFAFLVVVLIVPATVLLTNALAVWPGRRVARLRPAEVLRTE
jgi:ABC-type lipoprotein release transport system permease subunit